jgi:RNA polymerase sigma-70 factor (ECF subfamily)
MTDHAPLAQIYSEHFRFVWKCLRRLGVREADLSDAVQDVFLVVHRKLPEFEARSAMTTWLFGICMRVASDRRRSASAKRERPWEEAGERASDAPNALECLDQRDKVAWLDALLDELPMQQRAVFALYELEEMSGGQIAELLEVPVGTVWSRLRLARESFRQALQRRQARERFEAVPLRGDT